MMNERLSSIMTTNVVTVSPEDSLEKVKELLYDKHIHHLPVVHGRKLVGIVTSWDLMKSEKRFEEYGSMTARDIMTTRVATLRPNELVGAAAMVFLKHLFHGLPIVDDEFNLVGIVTTHDILKYEFQREYPNDIFVRETHWIDA
ncbi:MAG: CBS domain-containing protein [Bacteroidota bacterium]